MTADAIDCWFKAVNSSVVKIFVKFKKKIFFYKGSGAGKSFTINQIIGINILPSKSGGDPSQGDLISSGCTRYPVKCTFTKDNTFSVESVKIDKHGKKR